MQEIAAYSFLFQDGNFLCYYEVVSPKINTLREHDKQKHQHAH